MPKGMGYGIKPNTGTGKKLGGTKVMGSRAGLKNSPMKSIAGRRGPRSR